MSAPWTGAVCLGGSFNPPHRAHLALAQAAWQWAGGPAYSGKVRLIPAAQSPHKQQFTAGAVPPDGRLAMLRAMTADVAYLQTDDRELRRPPPSYTIDTIESLLAEGCGPVAWIIGADQWQRLPTWHRLPDLVANVHWLVAGRPGFEVDTPRELADLGVRCSRLATDLLPISSSSIRQQIATHDRDWESMVTPSVAAIIKQQGYYGIGHE